MIASTRIRWSRDDDLGYASDGFVYVLNREAALDEPPYWEPCYFDERSLKSVPRRFLPMGWMTKARAKAVCVAHNTERLSKSREA